MNITSRPRYPRLPLQLMLAFAFLSIASSTAPYSGDRELDGIALYAADGTLIEGVGLRPERLRNMAADLRADAHHAVAIVDVESHGGSPGRLYLSSSTRSIDALQRHDVLVASGLCLGAIMFALILAVPLSRRIARRVVRTAHAADRIAPVAETDMALNHELSVSSERARLEHRVQDRIRALEQSGEMYRLMAESTRAIPFILNVTNNRMVA